MTGELVRRRQSYLPRCISPPCVPVHDDYSRLSKSGATVARRRLMKLVRKMMSETKRIRGPPAKSVSFQYDAVSYSQNFDDGRHRDDDRLPLPPFPRN